MTIAIASCITMASQVWVSLSAVPDRLNFTPLGRPWARNLSMTSVLRVSIAASRGTFSGGRISRVTVRTRSR